MTSWMNLQGSKPPKLYNMVYNALEIPHANVKNCQYEHDNTEDKWGLSIDTKDLKNVTYVQNIWT